MDIFGSISALILPPKHWRDGSVSPFPVHWRVSPGTRLGTGWVLEDCVTFSAQLHFVDLLIRSQSKMVLATIYSLLSLGNFLLLLLLLAILHYLMILYEFRNMPPGPRLTSLPVLGNVLSLDFKAKDLNGAFQRSVKYMWRPLNPLNTFRRLFTLWDRLLWTVPEFASPYYWN